MATVQDIYTVVCYDLLEDGGLQLGIITLQDFIDLLNLTLLDYLKSTGLIKQIYTQTVDAGFSDYPIPDTMMMVESAYLAGVLIERSTVQEISNVSQDWRNDLGVPKVWHEDGLPLKTVELAPVPNYNSTYIPGPSEPAPPHAQIGDWTVIIGGNPVLPASHRGLTFVGSQKPAMVSLLTDPIPILPDDFALSYLPWGVLARVFGGDNEDKDADRAAFCFQQYMEGVALGRAIAYEMSLPA